MESDELKIGEILQDINSYANEANIGNVIKGRVKKFITYRKDFSQIESTQKEYLIKFTSNVEKEKYYNICIFNKKLQNYAENKKIKYRYLQFRYKLGDDFMPINDILTVQDNLPYTIQNQNKNLCILICELNQFQPNSNIHYFKEKFLEICSCLNNKKNIEFKVIFLESISREPLSNKKFYKKFSSLHSFQEKLKIFACENSFEKILFYYVPKISSNSLLKTSFEFFIEKEKLPFFMVINPNNKIIYEGYFHNVDFLKTLDNLEKYNNNIIHVDKEKISLLEKEIESFHNFSLKHIHQDLTKEEYKNIKKILYVEFKQKILNVHYNFPSSYISEMFCLEKQYNFEKTHFETTYKKALINHFFTKDLQNFYFSLKKLFLDFCLSDKILDFCSSESKKLIIHKFVEFFSKFFKNKTVNFLVSFKINSYQIINTSSLSLFKDEIYKLCKVYYLINYHFLTSPLISFYNFIPCLNLGDQFLPIRYLQTINSSKDEVILEMKNNEKVSIIIFLSLNAFQNKSIYEEKIIKIKHLFSKHFDQLRRCNISVVYFNTFNDFSFSIKSKNELMQQFLSLISPYKNIDFFFLDTSPNPLFSLQYLVYFNKINTIKSIIVSKEGKLAYNDSIFNPNFHTTLNALMNKDNIDILLNKQSIMIEKDHFKPLKDILDILCDEISLYLERTLNNKECRVNYSKLRSLTCKGNEIKIIKDFYTIPRIYLTVHSEKEKQTIVSYFESEVFSKIDRDKIILEINVVSNN
jgi:hypothetical protein